jgi:hypothetical protein
VEEGIGKKAGKGKEGLRSNFWSCAVRCEMTALPLPLGQLNTAKPNKGSITL